MRDFKEVLMLFGYILLAGVIALAIGVVIGLTGQSYAQEGSHEYQTLEPPEFPDILPLECGIEKEVPEYTFVRTTHSSTGLVHHQYDTDQDGHVDTEISIPLDDLTNKHPLFYSFDRDEVIPGLHGPLQEDVLPFIQRADIVYVDMKRDGTCEGIMVHWTPMMAKQDKKPFKPEEEL